MQVGLKCKAGCKDAHPRFDSSIHVFSKPSYGAWMEQRKKYIMPMTSHPCRIQVRAIGALVVKHAFVRMELSSSVQIEIVA